MNISKIIYGGKSKMSRTEYLKLKCKDKIDSIEYSIDEVINYIKKI